MSQDHVWFGAEEHAQLKAPTPGEFEALLVAIQGVCEGEVRNTMRRLGETTELDSVDWFGPEGQQLGRQIFDNVERSLRLGGLG